MNRLWNFLTCAVIAAGSTCAAAEDRLPIHESAAGVIAIATFEKSPAELAAIDIPQTASLRGTCRKPGTLQFVFDHEMLGRQIHRQILYLDVSRGDEVRKEKDGVATAESRVPKLNPAFPTRAAVRVGEPFDVQWVIQGLDIPGEWKLRRIKFDPAEPLPVRTREQAIARIQAYERKLYRKMSGKEAELPPLASKNEPHSVDESDDAFRIEYRQPFGAAGGGYIKTFSVSKQTGEVSRLEWRLGR